MAILKDQIYLFLWGEKVYETFTDFKDTVTPILFHTCFLLLFTNSIDYLLSEVKKVWQQDHKVAELRKLLTTNIDIYMYIYIH